MNIASSPNHEKERLQALYDQDILDTAAEKVFDGLSSFYSKIRGTPTALISLIDSNG